MNKTLYGKTVVYREGIYALSLDDFCRESGKTPNLIKMDVDGSEGLIMKGGSETLNKSSLRSLIVEITKEPETFNACENYLTKAGLARTESEDTVNFEKVEVWSRELVASESGGRN